MLNACGDSPTAAIPRSPRGPAAHDDYCGFGSYGDCALQPITSTPGDNGCTSPATEIDYCAGGGDDGGGTVGDGGWEGAGYGRGGGTPNPPTPTDTTLKDSCRTPDPVVNSPSVQAAFQYLWSKSNFGPNVAMSQRIEQGGWLIRSTDGTISFLEFPAEYARTSCGIDVPPTITPPPGAIGWLHTHPYQYHESLTACEWQSTPWGSRPLNYTNDPSIADDRATQTWIAQGYAIKGYMIDADKVVVFTGSSVDEPAKYARCAY